MHLLLQLLSEGYCKKLVKEHLKRFADPYPLGEFAFFFHEPMISLKYNNV